jgi:hypothetical protein
MPTTRSLALGAATPVAGSQRGGRSAAQTAGSGRFGMRPLAESGISSGQMGVGAPRPTVAGSGRPCWRSRQPGKLVMMPSTPSAATVRRSASRSGV